MLGWGPVVDDGSTFCTMCGERFIATLSFRVWMASGAVVDDSCSYLSPALMRCQLEALVVRLSQDSGLGVLCVQDMLHLAPHLYWNLAWYNTRMARPPLPLPYASTCAYACLGCGQCDLCCVSTCRRDATAILQSRASLSFPSQSFFPHPLLSNCRLHFRSPLLPAPHVASVQHCYQNTRHSVCTLPGSGSAGGARVCPVVVVAWSEAMALSRMAAVFPESLNVVRSHERIVASLTPSSLVGAAYKRVPCA